MSERDPRSDPHVGDVLARAFERIEVVHVDTGRVWYLREHLLTRTRFPPHVDTLASFAVGLRFSTILACGLDTR